MKFLHLRSSVAGKMPAAGALDVGQIAINFNDSDPFLCIKDSAGAVRRLGGTNVGATPPGTPVDGALWVDTSTDPPKLMVWDATNTKWEEVGATPPDATTTVKGIIELATTAEAEAGTDTVRAVTPAGLKAGIVKISGGASATAPTGPTTGQIWTDTSKSPPAVNVWDGTKWVEVGATPADATTTTKGIVQLADAAAVIAGTAGRVVTADQLKTTNDAIAAGLADAPDGTAAGTLQYVRQVVTTGTTGSFTQTKSWAAASLADASETVKGIIELATTAEAQGGTDAVRAITPKTLNDARPDAPGGGSDGIRYYARRVTTTGSGSTNATIWSEISQATESAVGLIELATTAEVDAGTDTERAVTPKTLADNYLALNIANLPALP